MRNIVLLLLLFPFVVVEAQVFDDFSDGDFTHNPTWSGVDSCYIVNGNGQLQLNASVAGISFLSLPIGSEEEKEWRFWIREAFSPSANNYTDVYLSYDIPTLGSSGHGYFLRFGEAGSSDAVELFRRDGDIVTSICRGRDGLVASSFAVAIKVVCSADGQWTILSDFNGSGSYQFEAQGVDDIFPRDGYFGFWSQYTSSNAKKIYFDNVYIGSPEVDDIPPSLIVVKVVDEFRVSLFFDEGLDESTATDCDNYFVSPDMGCPIEAVLSEGADVVTLRFSTPFQSSLNYTISITALADPSGNVMDDTEFIFSYYQVAEYDVVINEIMADPTPIVGLPEWEYVELYNVTDHHVDLDGWKLLVGSTQKTFESVVMPPHSYLIICHQNAVEELSNFGPIYGLTSLSIANAGTTLTLKNEDDITIHAVSFTMDWYHDADKKNGGWSLEQIAPNSPCAGADNWTASVSTMGGTPGFENSVYDPSDVAPKIHMVEHIGGDTLFVRFSQFMNPIYLTDIAAYRVVEMDLHPILAIADFEQPYHVKLCFDEELERGRTLHLEAAATLINCIGIPLATDVMGDFVIPAEISENDIVINEIMADPTPVVGLPEWEYVELYNNSPYDINLEGWVFTYGSSSAVLPAYVIPSHSYLLLCAKGAMDELSDFGPCVGLSGFSIANNGSTLMLFDNEDNIISKVSFSKSWYQDAEKQEGGWSLEQIDPDNPCAGSGNWAASQDYMGGTPGAVNSIMSTNVIAPKVARISMFSDFIVHLWFDQQMDILSMMNVTSFMVLENGWSPAQINVNPNDKSFVELVFNNSFGAGVIYTLVINGVVNCVGVPIEEAEVLFGLPNDPALGDIVVNEILFDPIAPGVDYVELYNNTDKVFDLSTLNIGMIRQTFPNPADTTLRRISDDSRLFLPHSYVLLTSSSYIVYEQYGCDQTTHCEMSSFINYPNGGATVILMNTGGLMIDQMTYSEKMHHPLLKVTKGVALERVSADHPSNDVNNWKSASESAGYGTPGCVNSMTQSAAVADDAISISPEIFSPDGDGFDDVTFITYKLDSPGFIMNAYVFNIAGQMVRHLAKGMLLSHEGSIIWDGRDEYGSNVGVGIYVIVTEVFNLEGVVRKYKNSVVVAAK